MRANQRRGMCSDGVDGLGPGVHPAVTRRDTRAPVGRKRTNESANEKSHTLRSDGALLRKRCREYDDERFLILRVLSRELKEVGGEQNEHSTPPKPQRAPQFSPTREKKCTGLDLMHLRATQQPRSFGNSPVLSRKTARNARGMFLAFHLVGSCEIFNKTFWRPPFYLSVEALGCNRRTCGVGCKSVSKCS